MCQKPNLSPSQVWWWKWKLLKYFHSHIFQKPLETSTLVLFLEPDLVFYVTNWITSDGWLTRVEIVTIFFIQPNLHHPHVILVKHHQLNHQKFIIIIRPFNFATSQRYVLWLLSLSPSLLSLNIYSTINTYYKPWCTGISSLVSSGNVN